MTEPIAATSTPTPTTSAAPAPAVTGLDRILSYLAALDEVATDLGPLINPGIGAGALIAGKLIAIAQAASTTHQRVTGAPIDLSQHQPLEPLP